MPPTSPPPPIRLATPTDLPSLPALQLAAGEAFRSIGMAEIADNPPPRAEDFAPHQQLGQLWVTVDDTDRPQGFVLVRLLDGCAHIEQVSVHPAAGGRGLGRELIDHVAGWAAGRGLAALTLSTFRSVPWNAPYYRRLGFRELPNEDLTPGLRQVLTEEAAFGLDLSDRACMRRPVTATGQESVRSSE
ncbi:GNAT family N-acetyltransferase [Kitasatospora sp. NPDC051984]|uniref:GNAT family N-acetyltransferase n=1 Tax=Kitasatospora sp. NPDC051984 TaxID=3364059 RepID=UPI0037C58020